jgi:hypothetical protein
MNIPGFHAEASLSYVKQSAYRQDGVGQSNEGSKVVPQIARVSCGNQFLNTVCQPGANLGELGCWFLWWNRDWQIGCIRAHMLAAQPWCADCSVTII